MEANVCDADNLDADVLLPPRKRLLAGMRKQNGDANPHTPSSSFFGSGFSSGEFDTRLNKLLRSHLSDHSLSNEEIIEASRMEAAEAARAARNARALAEEKAAKAAKAIAAARAALELVSISDEEAASRHSQSKKNKTKKHVAVHALYDKNRGVDSCRTDEELAKNLHRAINSSPRNHQHKKLKTLPVSETSKASSSDRANYRSRENGKALEVYKSNSTATESGERVENGSKEADEEYMDDFESVGRKKGRFKQKKLPLSICNFKDQANPKEELKSKNSHRIKEDVIPTTPTAATTTTATTTTTTTTTITSNKSIFSVERSPAWKCQAFKEPTTCIKQNKVMQS
ncbi:hypothetical protein DM860_016300 [Cuscuta australis]|uniref:Uncharacterized protein n=1 Tax=Cuscuta australis TaxID=267555 RepID=A0A328E513_9ASTE|nr:hypothetical protein DM860_016300 [Cuscuta australis]